MDMKKTIIYLILVLALSMGSAQSPKLEKFKKDNKSLFSQLKLNSQKLDELTYLFFKFKSQERFFTIAKKGEFLSEIKDEFETSTKNLLNAEELDKFEKIKTKFVLNL